MSFKDAEHGESSEVDRDARVTSMLARIPVAITATWTSKTVTTDAPRYVPHLEWSLELALSSDELLLAAVFLSHKAHWTWGLVGGDPKSCIELSAKFFPGNWTASDDVHIAFEGRRYAVRDPLLKADPREVVIVTAPSSATTGDLVPIADLPVTTCASRSWRFADKDIQRRRLGRWRVRPNLTAGLPIAYRGLTSGSQTGSFTDSAETGSAGASP